MITHAQNQACQLVVLIELQLIIAEKGKSAQLSYFI